MSTTIHYQDLPETELLEQCISRRDPNAYAVLVERYQGLLCSLAYSIGGDFGQSEDIAQVSFVTAWKKLGTLRNR